METKEEFLKKRKLEFAAYVEEENISLPTLSEVEKRKIERIKKKMEGIANKYVRLAEKYPTIQSSSSLVMTIACKNKADSFIIKEAAIGNIGPILNSFMGFCKNKKIHDCMSIASAVKGPSIFESLMGVAYEAGGIGMKMMRNPKSEAEAQPKPQTEPEPEKDQAQQPAEAAAETESKTE